MDVTFSTTIGIAFSTIAVGIFLDMLSGGDACSSIISSFRKRSDIIKTPEQINAELIESVLEQLDDLREDFEDCSDEHELHKINMKIQDRQTVLHSLLKK